MITSGKMSLSRDMLFQPENPIGKKPTVKKNKISYSVNCTVKRPRTRPFNS